MNESEDGRGVFEREVVDDVRKDRGTGKTFEFIR
jgi:hypothetical protein